MGIFSWLRSSLSPRERLLNELADIAGRNEALAERLKRHAEMCAYPNIKAGLEQLAAKEEAHLKVLKNILADNEMWPKPPEPPAHEGSNNWERLSNDLGTLDELTNLLSRHAINWEPVDAEMSKRLFDVYSEDNDSTYVLRDLALRCDPQAID
jgi:hypothetical protein